MSDLDTIFVNVSICESKHKTVCVKYSGILCVIEKTLESEILNIPCTCMDRKYCIIIRYNTSDKYKQIVLA